MSPRYIRKLVSAGRLVASSRDERGTILFDPTGVEHARTLMASQRSVGVRSMVGRPTSAETMPLPAARPGSRPRLSPMGQPCANGEHRYMFKTAGAARALGISEQALKELDDRGLLPFTVLRGPPLANGRRGHAYYTRDQLVDLRGRLDERDRIAGR